MWSTRGFQRRDLGMAEVWEGGKAQVRLLYWDRRGLEGRGTVLVGAET